MEFEYLENETMLEAEKKTTNQFDNRMVRMASLLAKQLKLSLYEEKLFAMALSQLDFFNEKDMYVDLYVKDMQERLNITSGSDYSDLRDRLSNLMSKTKIRIVVDKETNDTLDGYLIRSVRTLNKRGAIRIRFDDEFKPVLKLAKHAYISIPLDDPQSYKTVYAILLQRNLTIMYKVGTQFPRVQNFIFTRKQMKDMYGLSETDYCYQNGKNKGKFKRPEFEKRTIISAVNEINEKSQVMTVEWKKERIRGEIYYRFYVSIATKRKEKPPVLDHEPIEFGEVEQIDPAQMSIEDFGY